jgi:transposase InsO family protein
LYSPGKAGTPLEPTLDWRGRGSSEHKRYERACGVKMHQLSNLMRWFRLHAKRRIGGKPSQRVDECAARNRDKGDRKKK